MTIFSQDAVPDGEERGAAALLAAGSAVEGEVRHVGRRGEDLVGIKHQHGESGQSYISEELIFLVSPKVQC